MTVVIDHFRKPHGKPLGRGGRPSQWAMHPVQLARSFSVLACLWATCAVFSVSVAYGQPGEIRNGDTAEPATEPTIAIGSERFRIPAGYIWRMYGNRDPYRSAVTLEALLPGLEPRTPHNRSDFEILGHGRRIRILIHPIGKGRGNIVQLLLNNIHAGVPIRLEEINPQTNGIHHLGRLDRYPSRDWFLVIQNRRVVMVIRCDAPESVPSPGCRVNLDYGVSVAVELNFSRSYLPDLFRIHQNLHQFLDAAEERAQGDGGLGPDSIGANRR